jgi:dCMP deaminase
MRFDQYFVQLAQVVATKSKDPSTKVGVVIVDSLNRVVSTGYNGFPRGVIDQPDRYDHKETKYRLIVHSEANAILVAARDLHRCQLYTTMFPCSECAKLIVQAGISRVYTPPPRTDGKWAKDAKWSVLMFSEAGVDVCFLEGLPS